MSKEQSFKEIMHLADPPAAPVRGCEEMGSFPVLEESLSHPPVNLDLLKKQIFDQGYNFLLDGIDSFLSARGLHEDLNRWLTLRRKA